MPGGPLGVGVGDGTPNNVLEALNRGVPPITTDVGVRSGLDPVNHGLSHHQLGLDHEQLTYRYAGRDFRLTDVHGRVLKEIIA